MSHLLFVSAHADLRMQFSGRHWSKIRCVGTGNADTIRWGEKGGREEREGEGGRGREGGRGERGHIRRKRRERGREGEREREGGREGEGRRGGGRERGRVGKERIGK